MRVSYRMFPFNAKDLWLVYQCVTTVVNRLMVHTLLMLTANGFAQKANLTTDFDPRSSALFRGKPPFSFFCGENVLADC